MEKRQLGLALPVKRSLLYNQSDSDSESDSSGDYILATDNNNSKPSSTNQLYTDGNFGHDDEPNCSEETPPPKPLTTVIENFDSTESQSRKSVSLPMAAKRGPSNERNFEQIDSLVSSLKKSETEIKALKDKLEQAEKENSAVITKLNQDHQCQNDQLKSEGEEKLAQKCEELEQLRFQFETGEAEHAAETSRLRQELGYQFRANEQLQMDCDNSIDRAVTDCESRIGQFLVIIYSGRCAYYGPPAYGGMYPQFRPFWPYPWRPVVWRRPVYWRTPPLECAVEIQEMCDDETHTSETSELEKQLQQDNKDLKSKNILMLNEIEELRKQLESKNNLMPLELEAMVKDSQFKSAELLTLTAKTEDLEEQNKHTCFKLGQKDAEIVTLNENINKLKKLNDSLSEQLQENFSAIHSYKANVEIRVESERAEFEAELQTKCEEISNLQVENVKLKQQCLSLEQKSTELYTSLKKKAEDLDDRVNKRMTLISAGVADINKKKQQLQQLNEDAMLLLCKTERILKETNNPYLKELQKHETALRECSQRAEAARITSEKAIQNHVEQIHVSQEKQKSLKNQVIGRVNNFKALYEEYKNQNQKGLAVSEETKKIMKQTLGDIEIIRHWNVNYGKPCGQSLNGDLTKTSVDTTPVTTNFVEKLTAAYWDNEDNQEFKIGLDVHTMCVKKNLNVTETSLSGQFVSLIIITTEDEQSQNTLSEILAVGYALDAEAAFKKAVDNLRHNKAVKKKRTSSTVS